MDIVEEILDRITKLYDKGIKPKYIYLGHKDFTDLMTREDIAGYVDFTAATPNFNGIEIIRVTRDNHLNIVGE